MVLHKVSACSGSEISSCVICIVRFVGSPLALDCSSSQSVRVNTAMLSALNRAMLKRLDNIGNARLKEITMPRAMPLVYELDADLEPVRSAYAFGPLSGRFLANPKQIATALKEESDEAQLGSTATTTSTSSSSTSTSNSSTSTSSSISPHPA
jgi:hypothetical protein